MALKAKVTAVNALPSGDAIAVDVDYYDDAASAVILYHHAFEFSLLLTLVQMRTQVENYGVRVRNALDAKVDKATQFVGLVIDIP
jgi:hypothetical protein